MSGQAKQKKLEDQTKAPAFRGYIRVDISNKEQLEAFHAYEHEVSKEMLWNLLAEYCAEGYKIQCKIDGKGYKVEMFNLSAEEEARGYILSAYGKDVEKAATALFYKHHLLLEETWVNHLSQEDVEVR